MENAWGEENSGTSKYSAKSELESPREIGTQLNKSYAA